MKLSFYQKMFGSYIRLPRRIVTFFLVAVFLSVQLTGTAYAALPPEQEKLIDQEILYYDIPTCGEDGVTSVIAGTDLENFLKAMAYQESGGDPTQPGSAGGARGKYQYIDSTWASRFELYPPASEYPQAHLAPEEVQDAVVFLEYSQKFKEFDNDLFKLAVSHFYPIANSDESLLDVVPPSNVITPREYAEHLIKLIKDGGEWEKIPLKYAEAPEFDKWAQRAGVEAASTDSATDTGSSSVYVVGDSIISRSVNVLARALQDGGYESYLNGNGGRSIVARGNGSQVTPDGTHSSGLRALDNDKGQISKSDKIVINLGGNQRPVGLQEFRRDMGSMIDKAKGYNDSAEIYWVNVFPPLKDHVPYSKADVNRVIGQVATNKDVTVIDADSAGIELLLDTGVDDRHPTPAGNETYASTIVDAITGDDDTTDASDCVCDIESGATATTGNIDIKGIVDEFSIHSAAVRKLGGKVVAEEKANSHPATPASTMKLVIADVVIREGINLNKRISVTNEVLYDGSNDLGVSSITIRDALNKTLSVSSNVGANVLIKSVGGVRSFTQKAHLHGYSGTDVGGYYSTSARGKNQSTIADQVKAMNHLFQTNGKGYGVASAALKQAANNNNYYGVPNVIANKWAGTSEVAGNVGVFNIKGKKYIIGLYHNGSQPGAPSGNRIKSATAEIVKILEENTSGGDCEDAGGEGDIVAQAIKYSWKNGRKTLKMKPAYKKAHLAAVKNGEYVGGRSTPGIDCGGFITRVMRDSGADKDYNSGECNTVCQQAYMEASPDKYQRIGAVTGTSRLKPGDIAINSAHTYMFVGENSGFAGNAAAASLEDYAPTANNTYFNHSVGPFIWYRLK